MKSCNMSSCDMSSCNNDINNCDIKICDMQTRDMQPCPCDMPFDDSGITTYNPLQNILTIKPEKKVKKYLERLSYNKFSFIDVSGVTRTCFKKFITLVDYVKYLIGNYKPDEIEHLPSIDNDKSSLFKEYINSEHNYAYVDGFFYYLTSKLLKEGFVHGLDFYDNYICLTKNCEINIADDFEYLSDSTFFNEKMNKLFHFKDESFGKMFKQNVQLSISDEKVEIVADTLEDFDMDENEEPQKDEPDKMVEDELETETYKKVDDEKNDSDEENDSDQANDSKKENDSDEENDNEDHSTVDLSDSEVEEEDTKSTDWETESEDEEVEDTDEEIENLTLIVHKIPTHVVALELCEVTFDSILEENEMRIEELESAMFQVITILYLYQSVFKFTHNDLHTNNIMCVYTKKEFLHYKIMGKYYKVPTYGKIYKIIDFGRSIYSVNDTCICSDSFSENGTAHTQYNFGPFFNSNKPEIKPNYSFDLCRLACSMVDFIVDDIKNINAFRSVPVYDLIISWLYDDNNVNILYKKNGDERYPDFKLYKMIARIVHNHTPEKQFEHACFKGFVHDTFDNSTEDDCMDLDKIKSRVRL
jgi:hypothetical protein